MQILKRYIFQTVREINFRKKLIKLFIVTHPSLVKTHLKKKNLKCDRVSRFEEV